MTNASELGSDASHHEEAHEEVEVAKPHPTKKRAHPASDAEASPKPQQNFTREELQGWISSALESHLAAQPPKKKTKTAKPAAEKGKKDAPAKAPKAKKDTAAAAKGSKTAKTKPAAAAKPRGKAAAPAPKPKVVRQKALSTKGATKAPRMAPMPIKKVAQQQPTVAKSKPIETAYHPQQINPAQKRLTGMYSQIFS